MYFHYPFIIDTDIAESSLSITFLSGTIIAVATLSSSQVSAITLDYSMRTGARIMIPFSGTAGKVYAIELVVRIDTNH